MGKAADSERAKLRATFFNNLAVGTLVAGVLVPSLTLTLNGGVYLFSEEGYRALAVMVFGFVVAFASRRMADYFAKSICHLPYPE